MKSVSVAIMTFHREEGIRRMIGEYLAQDYVGKKELVILNDDPHVEYVYDHPEITIHNWSYRFRSHYLKQDKLVDLCNNEVIFFGSDDDIYKPWSITVAIKYLGNTPFVQLGTYYKKRGSATSSAPSQLKHEEHAGNFIVTKELYQEIGGHGDVKSDVLIIDKFKKAGKYRSITLPKNEIFWTWCLDKNRRKGVWEPSPEEDYHFDLHRKVKTISLK